LLAISEPLLVAGWMLWLFGARVQVTESTNDARVRVDEASRVLAASRAGRVARVLVEVGDRVQPGTLLITLDDRETAVALDRARDHLASLDVVVKQREREVRTEREALEALERAAGAASSEARARVDAAVAEAQLAEAQLAEIESLEQVQVASASELRRGRAEAAKSRAAARERRSASSFTRLDADRQALDRLARIVALERELSTLLVERTDARGQIDTLEVELETHRVRAPMAGIVGELAAVERGSWIDRGEPLGAVVPDGELEIEARFSATQAVGRIRAGQPARLRLAGFPWAQYGSVAAEVRTVGQEPRDGAIVVELSIERVPSTITLEHGLPGSVEVELERVTPASLLLRAAGRRLTGTGDALEATAGGPSALGSP
ncbi:MAG: HlyD family efflux transporter periplasmic adaptor subunit, partial [Nannocystaceae bacterium]